MWLAPFIITNNVRTTRTYFAPSALPGSQEPLPGALPQAFTFRAFGAETRSFHTVSLEAVLQTQESIEWFEIHFRFNEQE